MRSVLSAVFLAIALAGSARPAAAQAPQWPERIWFSVSGGVQPTANTFSDTFDVPLYTENETVSTRYPVKGGALIAARGGYRLWRQLTLGFGVTRYTRRAPATVDAQVPHPFFDNQFRQVQGTTSATRNEAGAHLLIGWMMPLTDRFRLLLTAGPSVLSVRQTFVTSVEISETYPYDTAAFKSATTNNATVTAHGFNAGADLFWMFSQHVGAGALVQVSHARAKEPAGTERTVTVDAGGAQAGAGLRFVF
jgi:hypothetical protein